MYLADAIDYQARAQPRAIALIFGQKVLHYGELAALIRRIAAMLAARGLRAGDVVGITMGNSPLHLVMLLALARLGAISVGVHPLRSGPEKQAVIDEYRVAAIVSDQPQAEVEGTPWILMDKSWMEAAPGAETWRRGAGSGDLPWRIGLSSGTTGRPKGVLYTQAQTLNLALLQRTVIDIGPNARFLVLMDLNATANVMRVLRHLLAGSAIVFPRTIRLVDNVLDAIERHGVTHTLVSPDIVGKWVRALPGEGLRALTLSHLAVGGGRMPPALKQAIVERLTPNVFINYGTTETGMVAVADPETHRRYPDSVGRVVPWARAQIVDGQDRPLPAGQAGIVRFRSIGAADGYYLNPAASAKTFRDGWVYPGDTGRLLADGVLVIESRVDDIINIGGAKIDPGEIEDALCEHPAVMEATVFGVKSPDGRERLCAAVVLRGAIDEQALLRYCQERVGQRAPRRIIALSELPRNLAGKVLKRELAARVAAERPGTDAAPAGGA